MRKPLNNPSNTIVPGILIIIEFSLALVVFVLLFFINAPYGRYIRKGWGPTIPARFGWMIMELPAFAVIAWLVLTNVHAAGPYGILFLLMWEAHYAYRVWVYPFLATSPRKPFPLLLVFFAICFNTINGTINGQSLIALGPQYVIDNWATDPRLWIGCCMFAAGFAIHAYSDRILRRLRRKGNGDYLLPSGGMFKFVASPNYLGEIVEWTGWAVATWSPAGAAFAVFTVANLLPRAVSNHRWYRKNFADFPEKRKVLVPFLW
jgi:protein-S-isoprenylcysteine O-methyltransferase Ste14